MTGQRRALDRVRLLGLAADFSLHHGDYGLEPHAIEPVLHSVAEAAREIGIVGAAAQAMVALGRDMPIFPQDGHNANIAFAVHVVRDLLRDGQGPELIPEFATASEPTRELAAAVADGGTRDEVLEVIWRYVKPWLRTDVEPVSSVGHGYSVEVARGVSDASNLQRTQIDLVVDTVAQSLRSASFDVLPPNTHAEGDEPGVACRHESSFDVMVAVAIGGSWRGGHQVRRAHARLKPVVAILPDESSPSCLFNDLRSGWVVPVRYNDPGQLGGSLIDAMDEVVDRLGRGQEQLLDLVLVDREVYDETRTAFLSACRDAAWRRRLEVWMPVPTATQILSSIEAFQGASRLQMNVLRTTLQLPILGAERYQTLRNVMSDQHRVAVDAFVERFGVPLADEIALMDLVATETMASLVDSQRFRSKRYLNNDELLAAWKQVQGE